MQFILNAHELTVFQCAISIFKLSIRFKITNKPEDCIRCHSKILNSSKIDLNLNMLIDYFLCPPINLRRGQINTRTVVLTECRSSPNTTPLLMKRLCAISALWKKLLTLYTCLNEHKKQILWILIFVTFDMPSHL